MVKIGALLLFVIALLGNCVGPFWPDNYFPDDMKVERVLYRDGQSGLREGCVALVAEIDPDGMRTFRPSRRVGSTFMTDLPEGWRASPLIPARARSSFYEMAFRGCGSRDRPLGGLPVQLAYPGAFYRIINGGEGIAIVAPHARMAAFFYFG